MGDTGLELASRARIRSDTQVLLGFGVLRSAQVRSNCYQTCYQGWVGLSAPAARGYAVVKDMAPVTQQLEFRLDSGRPTACAGPIQCHIVISGVA
jgi:hypothetical protein